MTHSVVPGETVPAGDDPFGEGPGNDVAQAPVTGAMPTLGEQPKYLIDAMQVREQIDPRETVGRTAPRVDEISDATAPAATQTIPLEAPAPAERKRRLWERRPVQVVGGFFLAATAAVVYGVLPHGHADGHEAPTKAGPIPTAAAKPSAPTGNVEASPAAIQYGNLTPWEKQSGRPTYKTLPETNPVNGQPYTTELPLFPDTLGAPVNPIDTVKEFWAQYNRMRMSNSEEVADDIIDHMVRDPRADSVRQKLKADWQWTQLYRQKLSGNGTNVPYLSPVFLPGSNGLPEFGFTEGDVDDFGNSNIRLKSGSLEEQFFAESTVIAQPSGNALRTFTIPQFTIAVGLTGLTNIIISQVDSGK